jgi:hypothetical protein
VSAWLDRLAPDSVVETYGLLVYLPHFDVSPRSPYRLQRVGPDPIKRRNPLVGSRELVDRYGAVDRRRPDVLVIPEAFAARYLPTAYGEGRKRSGVVEVARQDQDAASFFAAALGGTLSGYRIALRARPRLPAWATALGAEPIRIHSCTAREVWVLERSVTF